MTTYRPTDELSHRRRELKRQQAEMREGRCPDPITPPEGASPSDSTQVPNRYSGHSTETQPVSTGQAYGTQAFSQVDTRSVRPESPSELEMSLPAYIRWAARKNLQALQDAGAERKWLSAAHTFVRCLKAHSHFMHLGANEAADRLDEILCDMTSGAGDRWEQVLGDSDSLGSPVDVFTQFVESWSTVEHPIGEAPMEQALRLTQDRPLEFDGLRSERWRAYKQFLSVCYWLQVIVEPDPIFLPVREFGRQLKVDKTTISSYRRMAEREGYLTKVAEHQGRKKATEFRFVLDRVNTCARADGGDDSWAEVE